MFIDWFFAKNKPSLFKYPAYLGHTVHQEEYDKLDAIVKADKVIIQQQAREIEQLTEQLDASNLVKLQGQLDEANERVEVWRDRAQHWKAECEMLHTELHKTQIRELDAGKELDALRQQQIMLTTTTPTNVKPKGKPRTTGAKP